MSEKIYSQQTISEWIAILSSVNNKSLEVFNILKKEKIRVRDGVSYIVWGNGEVEEISGLGGASNLALIYSQFGEYIYRKGLVSEQSKFNAIAIKSNSIKNKLQSSPVLKGQYIPISNIIISNLESLIKKINIITVVTGMLDCVDENGNLAKAKGGTGITLDFGGFDWFDLLQSPANLFRNPQYVLVKDEIPDYSNEFNAIKLEINRIKLSQTVDIPVDDFPSTGINLNEKDTRELIDTTNRLNESSDSGVIISNESNEINSQMLESILDHLLRVLDFCQSINIDTDNIIFNMNVRFRNITLPVEEDDVFNLSTWLYAFQKQVMNTLYDTAEYVKQINDNQKTDSESLQTIADAVAQLQINLEATNTNVGNIIQQNDDIFNNLSAHLTNMQNQVNGIQQQQNAQNIRLGNIENLCFQILAKLP